MTLSERVPPEILRIIDASPNRVGEGLYLLEDIARLLLNDAALTQQLRTMRHELKKGNTSFNQQLLQPRNAEGDVGIDIEAPEEVKTGELPLVAIGGITRDNASEVIAAGADSIAVISAVLGAESPEEASRQIIDSLEKEK